MRVLFLDIDTLRPDHMGCYGYDRNTTPVMDQIAAEGVRFDNYYTSDAPCLPSRAAIMTGKFGIHNGVTGHGGTCADLRIDGKDRHFVSEIDQHTIHGVFRKAGYHTTSISTFPERHSAWWFSTRCNETYNVGGCGGEVGDRVEKVTLDWLDRKNGEDDWYLHVHLWDPHTPYRTPLEFGDPFEDVPLTTWINQDILNHHLTLAAPHGANEINMYTDETRSDLYPRHLGRVDNMDDVKRFFDGYDTGIAYSDYLIGNIVNKLKEQGIYDDTAIIISSDHGENMGELGLYAEHATADHPTCNIPMIIKWPNCKKGFVDKELHYNVDLLPTLAEMFSIDPFKKWDGKSYAKTLTEGKKEGHEALILSQMAHVCQRSVRFGDWLYIRTIHDGYHLYDKEMLFNLTDDPYEQTDLKEKHPEVCAKAAKYILDWQDEMMACSDSIIDPIWHVMSEGGPEHARGYLTEYVERLKKTGREEPAKQLEAKRCKSYY